jgi:hypothetical protein
LVAGCACPLGGQLFPVVPFDLLAGESRGAYYLGITVVMLAIVLLALVLLALTLLTFDRCMGRATLGPRHANHEPRRRLPVPRPHLAPPVARPAPALEGSS